MQEVNTSDNKRSLLPWIITAAMLAVFAASAVYYYFHTIIRDPVFLKPGATEVVGQLEDVYTDGSEIVMNGWCFRENIDTIRTGQSAFRVFLRSETGASLCFTAEYGQERPDVAAYFNNEFDYTFSGFQVRIPASITGTYEIALQQNEHRPDALLTGAVLNHGELQLEGEGQEPPGLKGTALQEIADRGYLCVSRPDVGMYIYQLGHTLYWIASEQYSFEEGWGYLQYQPVTIQPEKLPQERYEAGYTYDTREFYFENHEITQDLDCGPYRVAVMEIPYEYAVTRIETGYYVNDAWVWREIFAPDYAELMNVE